MPHYGDSIKEVGKSLHHIKTNAEAALRRAYPIQPKIERTRDIFDSTQPLEMTFTTDHAGMQVSLFLFFNKPPPQCALLNIKKCCQEFTVGPGAHLLQVDNSYVPGLVQVTINGFDTALFEERDPTNGLIYVFGTSANPQNINICYIRELP